MKLSILYDNETRREDLTPAWGFSCLIETGGKNILFDTGWQGSLLVKNMQTLGYAMRDVDAVVISHSHWDHIGGLPCVLNQGEDLDVYVPGSISAELKKEICHQASLHNVANASEIASGVWTTGEIPTTYKGASLGEQSLVIETENGLLVVTGCSHPGLSTILDKAEERGDLWGVLGGFHGFSDLDRLEGLSFIGPAHCTQEKKAIRERYPKTSRPMGCGYEEAFP